MRFVKIVASGLVVVVTVSCLAGCTGQAPEANAPKPVSVQDVAQEVQSDARIPADEKARIIARQQATLRANQQNSSKPTN